jgi:hypothetical protein
MASIFALLALSGVALLALFPDPRLLPPGAMLSEKATLFFLAATFLVALVPSLHRRLTENRDAATFALLSAFFVLFHLAERAGPREGFSIRFGFLPDDQFAVSYALRLVVVGAVVTFPLWWKGGGPQRFILAALLLIGILGAGIFGFLARFYTVGATETLDPTPLPTLFLQILGYASVAAICRAATASPATRQLALRALPFVLLLILSKFQFLPAPIPAEDAE